MKDIHSGALLVGDRFVYMSGSATLTMHDRSVLHVFPTGRLSMAGSATMTLLPDTKFTVHPNASFHITSRTRFELPSSTNIVVVPQGVHIIVRRNGTFEEHIKGTRFNTLDELIFAMEVLL